ncbi:hypothetical protein RQP46_007821 [Phenoliferia psychrophenolica]
MSITTLLSLAACVPAILGQAGGLGGQSIPATPPNADTAGLIPNNWTWVPPSLGPTFANATNYVFDRFITIMMENTDYETAAASPVFQELASKGILFTDYYAITHPSMPNYIASVSGSTQGAPFDDTSAMVFPNAPADVKTIVNLLEAKNISWASYQENMPEGLDYASHNYNNPGEADYQYYVRRHSGLMKFDSIVDNPERLSRHRNFNNFAEDLNNDSLPQWIWITPNILNDAHNSDIDYVSSWLNYFLVPLLENPNACIFLKTTVRFV